MKPTILRTVLIVLFAASLNGCAFLAGAAAGGTTGYVAGHHAGENEAEEEIHEHEHRGNSTDNND